MKNFQIVNNGDSAYTILFNERESKELSIQLNQLTESLRKKFENNLIELIPAYTSLTLIFEISYLVGNDVKEILKDTISNFEAKFVKDSFNRLIEIPVCYDKAFSPDIQNIIQASGLSKEEIIRIHTASTYFVNMLGFLPGFFYLSGLDERLYCSRKTTPELKIPAGSVGIGGKQTGVYPVSSPGGWQIIGRTPLNIFSPENEAQFLVSPMDRIRFVPIDTNEFDLLRSSQKLNSTHGNPWRPNENN